MREESFYSEMETDQRRNEQKLNEKVLQFELQIQEKNQEIQDLKNRDYELNVCQLNLKHFQDKNSKKIKNNFLRKRCFLIL